MTKQTYKKWSMADHAELVLMREARVPTKEIARALKRTPSSVVNHIYQHEIPYGRITEVTFEDVVDQAFSKHKLEFGDPDGWEKHKLQKKWNNPTDKADLKRALYRKSIAKKRKQRRKNTFMMVITAFIVFVGLVSIYLQIT